MGALTPTPSVGEQLRFLHDPRSSERRPRRLGMHDVAVRAGGQASVNDDLVSVEIDPRALRERLLESDRRQRKLDRIDSLRTVVSHRAPAI